MTLPYTAIRRNHDGEYVFLLNSQQKTRLQSVRSGLRLADKVEILEGLKQEQIVVTKGFLGLQAGKKVLPVKSK